MNKFGYFAGTEIEFFRTFLEPGDNVIEIGAFIGTHSIPIKKMIETGRLIVFEPQQHIYKILTANLILNGCGDVIALPYGIGDTSTLNTNFMFINPERMSILPAENNKKGNIISIQSIEHFKEFYDDLEKIKLIKIDAEGMEPQILNNIKDIIIKYQPFVFLEYDKSTLNNIFVFFTNMDYNIFLFNVSVKEYIYNTSFKILDENSKEIKDIYGDNNLFCIPKSFNKIPPLIQLIRGMSISVETQNIHSINDLNLDWYKK